jgi:Na+/H+ antiporter NhaA
LFVAELAFDEHDLVAQAKGGIFAASLLAGAAGFAVLRWGPRPRPRAGA